MSIDSENVVGEGRLLRHRSAEFSLTQPTVWCARCDTEATVIGTWRNEERAETFFTVECHGVHEDVVVSDLEVQAARYLRPPLAFRGVEKPAEADADGWSER